MCREHCAKLTDAMKKFSIEIVDNVIASEESVKETAQ